MIVLSKGAIASSIQTAGGFSPSDISGLVWWVDASAMTGFSNDDPVGDTGKYWEDLSTCAKDLTQSTATARPVYRTNILNSLPGVYFHTGRQLVLTADHVLTQPVTIFMVKNQSATNIASKYIGGDYSGQRFYIGNEQYTNRFNISINSYVFQNNFNSTGGLLTTYVVSGAATTMTNKNNTATVNPGVGNLELRRTGEPDNGPNGYLHEVIIYSGNIGATNISAVETYLRDKWGSGI